MIDIYDIKDYKFLKIIDIDKSILILCDKLYIKDSIIDKFNINIIKNIKDINLNNRVNFYINDNDYKRLSLFELKLSPVVHIILLII